MNGRNLPGIVLGSGSPRRRELLKGMGYDFTVDAPDVDETITGDPRNMVLALAKRKADAAAQKHPDAVVITADTLVALEGQALGKPHDDADARRMLRSLSGRAHEVMTGLCVTDTRTGKRYARVETTRVFFRSLTDDEIDAYIATGEPRDKAGAYAIQGGAKGFVSRYEGSYSNIVGLPTEALQQILDEIESAPL